MKKLRHITRQITLLQGRERVRMIALAIMAAILLAGGFIFAAKKTLSPEARLSRQSMKLKGKVIFKDSSFTIKKEMEIEGVRGRILDRTGKNVLAQSSMRPAFVFRDAAELKQPPARAAWFLSRASGLPMDRILDAIAKRWNGYVLSRDLDQDTAGILTRVIKKKTGGFTVKDLPSRTYPSGPAVTNVVGLVDVDGKPRFGIEYRFDDVLRPGKEEFEVFIDNRYHTRLAANMEKARNFDPATLDGNDVVLTIDQRIQAITFKELARRVKYLRAKGGAAVVLDPQTFEILAMATFPAINARAMPKAPGKKRDDGSSPWQNKVIQYAYEPGSVGKVLALTTAIDNKVVGLKSMLDTHHGICKFGKNTVRDTHHSRSRWITVLDATKYSSNCAFGYLGQKMGPQLLYTGLKRLGIGERTGVELPYESRGLIRSLGKWKPGITDAGASYGYGYRVTPLQIARAIAIIANNGRSQHVHLVMRTQARTGKVLWRPTRKPPEQVISPATAAAVRQAMATVTQKGGTGTMAVPEGYCVAGKTGTAKINIRGHYRAGRYVATFAGFAPCDHPRVVVVVTIIDPKFHKYGGPAAGPVFRRVVEQILPMLGVAPKPKEGA